MNEQQHQYKWRLLCLAVFTNMMVTAIPSMGMSVLAKEISHDLGLSLVQVGIIWGIGSLPGIFAGLLGGALGDKIGPKRVLIICSLLAGLLGAARGFAFDFLSLAVIVIVLGMMLPFITMNTIKIVGQCFPARMRGQANGLIAMGMALGFLLGSMLSATVLSPLLGGWRNVLIVYGTAGSLFSIPWLFAPTTTPYHAGGGSLRISIRKTIMMVVRLKKVRLLGLALLGFSGCIHGLLGYLPLYLRGLGWNAVYADGALSAFHASSLVCVLPLSLLSDRIGSRKRLLLSAAFMTAMGTGLLCFITNDFIWVAVIMAGLVRDAFLAIILTMVVETEEVGVAHAGTATGFAMAFSGIGNFLAPPIGNSLAVQWPGAPFAFFAGLAVFGMACLSRVKQDGTSSTRAEVVS